MIRAAAATAAAAPSPSGGTETRQTGDPPPATRYSVTIDPDGEPSVGPAGS